MADSLTRHFDDFSVDGIVSVEVVEHRGLFLSRPPEIRAFLGRASLADGLDADVETPPPGAARH
ncbi:hypothetical protein [Paracoccus laeviglucosivorans]|nr:hypothetical protein [Paracoccus laeviglucosivorans]